ncbi:MAG: CAP domain-containing protein [Meiothermus sp.]|nr:CAP domain-containing protein [Meiothermus sp.]
MRQFRLYGLWTIVILLIAACGGGSAPENNTRFVPYPEEAQVLGLVNGFRSQARACGNQQFPAAPALTWVEAVGDTAWFHSVDMGRVAGEGHVGASTEERLRARGFDPGPVAEHRKKTTGPANPSDAFNAWAADPAACASMMSPNFTVMGAGMSGQWDNVVAGNVISWTLILTTPRANAPAPAATLSVSPTATTVTVGGAAVPFTATLTNSTSPITWTLTGPGSISGTTGPNVSYTPPTTGGAGTAILTARAGALLTATATITINAAAPTPTLTITPAQATTSVGGTPITFTATTNTNQNVGWALSPTSPGSISNTTGATTTYTPPATGGAGTATLCAAVSATLSRCITITVNAAVPAFSVTPTTAFTTVGGPNVILTSSTNQVVSWTMTGPGTFSWVGETFTYIPPTTGNGGTAVVTVTSTTGLTASATITVGPPVSLSVSPTTATVTEGGAAIPFTATLVSSNATINWSLTGPGSLSATTGASINYTPPATGGAATATLTATAAGRTATATITINSSAPALTVSPATATTQVGGTPTGLTATLLNSNATINWSLTGPGSLSATTGATVNYRPPATGGAGTATVTATAGALTASATITINAAPNPDIAPFLTLINNFRSQQQTCQRLVNGVVQTEVMPAVPPVVFQDQLNTAARLHSEDMATNNYFDHTGLNGSTFSQRVIAAGYTGAPQGENISAGNADAQGAFNSWRNSQGGHCQGMMSPNANEIGLGYGFNANSQWTHYWTLVMGKR